MSYTNEKFSGVESKMDNTHYMTFHNPKIKNSMNHIHLSYDLGAKRKSVDKVAKGQNAKVLPMLLKKAEKKNKKGYEYKRKSSLRRSDITFLRKQTFGNESNEPSKPQKGKLSFKNINHTLNESNSKFTCQFYTTYE